MILGMTSSSKAASALSKVLAKSNINRRGGNQLVVVGGGGSNISTSAASSALSAFGTANAFSAATFSSGSSSSSSPSSAFCYRQTPTATTLGQQQQQQQKSSSKSCLFSSTATAVEDNNMEETTTPESLFEQFTKNNSNSNNGPELIGHSIPDAMYALYKADAVCFDVDSTVIAEEGIDVLAEYLGKGEEVSALTKAAMDGGMKFQDALGARLDLLQPSKRSILQLLDEQPLQLTPGVEQLMKSLQSAGVDIWLVSGGFRIMIEPVADMLNIPRTNIVANTLFFEENDEVGTYTGFDPTEPTSADMGKPKALTQIQTKMGYKTMVMVGDGATDAQAKPPADAFVGFGGVEERQAVKDKADWFVKNFDDMTWVIEQRNNSNSNSNSKTTTTTTK